MEAHAIGQSSQRIKKGEFGDPPFRAPFVSESDGDLPNFVGMKRLLQVEQLVLRRHALAELGRVDIRKGRADDDFDFNIQFPDLLSRPCTVWARRHTYVEKHDRELLTQVL